MQDRDHPAVVLSVLGTRPEAIKMAPLIRALEARGERIRSRVCVTAQHRDMLDQALGQFRIRPDHDLDIMTAGQSSTQVSARVLERLERVLNQERPDWVLVQGDTATTAAGALAARQSGFRVAHVEAGLRTFDPDQPFPEEIHRTLVAALAALHLAPTPTARNNLLREGVPPERIVVSGNTGIDALYHVLETLSPTGNGVSAQRRLSGRVILATAHRRESLGSPLIAICRALRTIATRYPSGVRIVFPVHPRREVREVACRELRGLSNVELVDPLDYAGLVQVMCRCDLVITDSGGLQEEAPTLGKPVLVLRNVTERPEAVAADSARIVGTDEARIVEETVRLLEDPAEYARMARPVEHYGDGRASERIVQALLGEPVNEWVPSTNGAPPGWVRRREQRRTAP